MKDDCNIVPQVRDNCNKYVNVLHLAEKKIEQREKKIEQQMQTAFGY